MFPAYKMIKTVFAICMFMTCFSVVASEEQVTKLPDLYIGDQFEAGMSANTKITVVVDACVTQGDYFSIRDSEFFKSEIERLAIPLLRRLGYVNVTLKSVPTVCALLPDSSKVRFKPADGGMIKTAFPPYVNGADTAGINIKSLGNLFFDTHNLVGKFAYDKMKLKLTEIAEHEEHSDDDFPEKKEKLTRPQVDYSKVVNNSILEAADWEGADVVLVMVGDGTLVTPTIASLNNSGGIMIGAMFGGALFALMGTASIDAHYFISAAMFDAQSGQLIWKNLGFANNLRLPDNYSDKNLLPGDEKLQRTMTVRNLMAVSGLFPLAKQKINIDESDGLNPHEVRQLLVGNTLQGKLKNGQSFSAYFNQVGKLYSEELDQGRFDGRWYIDGDGNLCLVLSEAKCGKFMAMGGGKYQLHESGPFKSAINAIKEGNMTPFE